MVIELCLHVDRGIRGWERIKPVVVPFSGLRYMGEKDGGLWLGQSISPICLRSPDADCTEIKNKFMAARSRLPVMFIATPKDQWSSMWTQERPSAQVSWTLCPCPVVGAGLGQFPAPSAGASTSDICVSWVPATSRTARFHSLAFFPPQILQRLLVLASESLRALEEQLMDPLNSQDVKVTPQSASIRIFRLWQSILVIGGHCRDL